MAKIRNIGFVIFILLLMVFAIVRMFLSGSLSVIEGKADLQFDVSETVYLNGEWEFYWNRFVMPEAFDTKQSPLKDSFMKVPGSWSAKNSSTVRYPNHGIATYRLVINYPSTLKDPAVRIQSVAASYKLYANGLLVAEVGKSSDQWSDFKEDEKVVIVDLPNTTQPMELIFQVSNLNYARGGIRETPVFGSKEVLEKKESKLLAVQLLFIGCVFIFSLYYLLLFLLQSKNKTALLFSILCFITALRALLFGASPVGVLFPNASFGIRIFINYLTGYNMMPIMALFVLSVYPLESRKRVWIIVVIPTLLFNVLLITPPAFMSFFTKYLYVVLLTQMLYIIYILIKAVLQKKDYAIFMYITFCIFFLTIIQDILCHMGIGGANVTYMFLFGNFAVIVAMSYVQAKQQSNTQKKLILFNEQLVEADRLKDRIMSTEMSFLHAQIKPHFLYNALDAIANVCEKDGHKAGKLIIDLAVYLRGSLEFNNLDKMTTIEKEMEFVETYFNIEQARFGEKIQLLKAVESQTIIQIPVLIMQPLVENAVRHGISKKVGGGTIWINITHTRGDTYIEVNDDGVGMEAEKLESILKHEHEDQSVGLLNIHHRLMRLYGQGLEITSEEGFGTSVKFMIPGHIESNGGKDHVTNRSR